MPGVEVRRRHRAGRHELLGPDEERVVEVDARSEVHPEGELRHVLVGCADESETRVERQRGRGVHREAEARGLRTEVDRNLGAAAQRQVEVEHELGLAHVRDAGPRTRGEGRRPARSPSASCRRRNRRRPARRAGCAAAPAGRAPRRAMVSASGSACVNGAVSSSRSAQLTTVSRPCRIASRTKSGIGMSSGRPRLPSTVMRESTRDQVVERCRCGRPSRRRSRSSGHPGSRPRRRRRASGRRCPARRRCRHGTCRSARPG